MIDAFIVDGTRTPIGNFGGALSSVRADDLAAGVIRALVARHANLNTELIDDV
ncbi:MAG: 3-oxoadipyl-CoA thiolase, partial [Flavobacteriales bacterium]